MIQYLAYEGSEFTIEWYTNEKGYSEALEYFLAQPQDRQRKILNLFRLIGEHGKIHDEQNSGTKVMEFTPSSHNQTVTCVFSLKARNSSSQMPSRKNLKNYLKAKRNVH